MYVNCRADVANKRTRQPIAWALRLLVHVGMADLDSDVAAFSDIEEDFFRAGDAMSSAQTGEIALVEPEPAPSKGLWSRLFERPLRIPTDASFVAEPAPMRARPPTERPAVEEELDDDDWEWMLAAARARSSRPATSPGF